MVDLVPWCCCYWCWAAVYRCSPAEEFGFGAGAFEIEHLGSSRPFSGAAVLAPATAQADPRRGPLAALQMRCKNIDTLLLGTPRILCSWAPQGYFAVGHCRDTLRLVIAGILFGWTLQGYFAVGHIR